MELPLTGRRHGLVESIEEIGRLNDDALWYSALIVFFHNCFG
ncbi:MAG: hypothetical protein ACI9R3_001956 [Verrucomicrobiales bacterium]|jgi:hypothetical protein